jgi:outer membrane biosynthesis protein TonB
MRKRRNNLPVIAFSTSLLVHAILLIALPYAIEASTPKDRPEAGANSQSHVMVMPVEVELGIDAPTPETPAWLGFAEPQVQRAEKAEIEQAAFTVEPVAAAPPALAMSPDSSTPAQPAPHSQPEPQPAPLAAEITRPAQEGVQRDVNPPPSTEELVGEIPLGENAEPNLKPNLNPNFNAPQPNPEQVQAVADAIEAVKELLREIQRAVERQSDESTSAHEPKPLAPGSAGGPAQPSPPQAQPAPHLQPGPPAPDSPTEVGSPADRQSTPTSLIDVPPDQWQLGKPLAREGLTLKPKRPEFTLLTMLTAAPGNPHVIINFGRDGVPVTASLARSSGDKRVDDAILASLYRWRAEGKELEKVMPGKTLDVRMRIVLNRRSTE